MAFLKEPAAQPKDGSVKEEKFVPIEKQTEQPTSETKTAKPKVRRTTAAQKPTPQENEFAHEPFSTRLRVDIIRNLKDEAFHREREGIASTRLRGQRVESDQHLLDLL